MKWFKRIVIGAFALIFVVSLLGRIMDRGKSPAPSEVLERLKAAVESEGQPAVDVFGTPSGIGVAPGPTETAVVEEIKYNSTLPPFTKDVHDIPAGTVVHYYQVIGTRTKAGENKRPMRRLFYVYPDATGQWKFFENQGADRTRE